MQLNVFFFVPDGVGHVEELLIVTEVLGIGNRLRQILHGRFGKAQTHDASQNGQSAQNDVRQRTAIRRL